MRRFLHVAIAALSAVCTLGIGRAEAVFDGNLPKPTGLKAVVRLDEYSAGFNKVIFYRDAIEGTAFQVEVTGPSGTPEIVNELGSDYMEWNCGEISGDHRWRARTVTCNAYDEVLTYGEWADGPAFNADESTPEELVKPSGIKVQLTMTGVVEMAATANFTWTRPDGEQYCQFYIYNSQNVMVAECSGQFGSAGWQYEYDRMPIDTYTFKARGVAFDIDGVSVIDSTEWVEDPTFSFTTTTDYSGQGNLTPPTDMTAEQLGLSIFFTWEGDDENFYEIAISKDGNPIETLTYQSYGQAIWPYGDIRGLCSWKIRAVVYTGSGAVSEAGDWVSGPDFTVREPGVAAERNILSGVSLYPNPTSGSFTVSVPVKADVDIYGLDGRRVEGRKEVSGSVRFTLNRTGVYMVRIGSGEAGVVKKLVVR